MKSWNHIFFSNEILPQPQPCSGGNKGLYTEPVESSTELTSVDVSSFGL